jgi:hypothetical protein
MSDFGYGGQGRHRHHHHHHHQGWGDFGPPPPIDPLDTDGDDFGCDPLSAGFRVFGEDGDDASQPQDDADGGQGGVLDAAVQVAQGIPDMILPPAPLPIPPFPHRHHRRHHALYIDPRFDPYDRLWDARLWARLPRYEQERHRRIWAARGYRFHGEWDQALQGAIQHVAAAQNAPQPPWQRYSPQGYRPRGPHFDHRMQGGMFPGFPHPHHHRHHHHHQDASQLPPGFAQPDPNWGPQMDPQS